MYVRTSSELECKMYVPVHLYMYVCMYVYTLNSKVGGMSDSICICTYVQMYVCMHVQALNWECKMYVPVNLYMYVCTYTL